jgi:hypothetical protein
MKYSVAFFFMLLIGACVAGPPAFDPKAPHFGEAEVQEWLSKLKSGAAFGSRNGHYYGMDSDATIVLMKDKQVVVEEDGVAVQTYKGTFTVDDSGAIHVELKDYRAKWPDMYLYQDKKGTFLFPTDKNPGFRLGDRGAGTETSRMAPYWQFKRTH